MPAVLSHRLAFFMVWVLICTGLNCPTDSLAQTSDKPGFRLPVDPDEAKQGPIRIVFFGASDCPVCRAWMSTQWPLWQASTEFAFSQFFTVEKSLLTAVTAELSWPQSISPALRAQLIRASSGRRGSPQTAIVVKDQLIDYLYGAPTPAFLSQIVLGLRGQAMYPQRPCLQLGPKTVDECAQEGPAEQLR
jgi:hypothetical protein